MLLSVAVGGVGLLPFSPVAARPVSLGMGDTFDEIIPGPAGTTVRLRYELYTDLRDDSEGGTVVVPPDNPLDPYPAREIASTELVIEDYEPEITARVAAEVADQAEDRGSFLGGSGEWDYIIVDGHGAMRLGVSDRLLLLVPESMWPQIRGAGS